MKLFPKMRKDIFTILHQCEGIINFSAYAELFSPCIFFKTYFHFLEHVRIDLTKIA